MNAFLFIPLLAATWALGFVLALFAAHYFLTVLESTAAGNEKVVWPEEPLIDWFWKVFYLAFLGGVWLTPMIILGRLLTPDPWGRFAFTAGAFWLFFPIGMISSQSAESPWVPFWPGVFARMSQRKSAVLGFYLLSIPIAIGFVGSFQLIVTSADTSFGLSLLLAPVAAAAFLIYARALGRLGLVLSFTKGADNEPIKSRRRKKKPKPQIGEHTEQPVQKQPSELPAVETPFEGAITGYDVVFDDRPIPQQAPNPARPRIDDEDNDEPLQLADSESDPTGEPNRVSDRVKPPPLPEPPAFELALWADSQRVKEPKQPYDASLITFLGHQRTAMAWLVLGGGLALFGGMIRALRELRP